MCEGADCTAILASTVILAVHCLLIGVFSGGANRDPGVAALPQSEDSAAIADQKAPSEAAGGLQQQEADAEAAAPMADKAPSSADWPTAAAAATAAATAGGRWPTSGELDRR